MNSKTRIELSIKDNGKINAQYHGTQPDLVNLIAVALDIAFLREVFYLAVKLDYEHNKVVGRRQNIAGAKNEPTN